MIYLSMTDFLSKFNLKLNFYCADLEQQKTPVKTKRFSASLLDETEEGDDPPTINIPTRNMLVSILLPFAYFYQINRLFNNLIRYFVVSIKRI